MIASSAVENALRARFGELASLGDGLFRGERRYQGRPYAVAYFDLSDSIIFRAENLIKFQERVLGTDFFSADDLLRWNNYLYFVAGPNSTSAEGFDGAKALIESNRDYARKFVVSPDELVELLSETKLFSGPQIIDTGDVTESWRQLLVDNDLGYLLDKPHRTKALERITEGWKGAATTIPAAVELSLDDVELSRSSLSSLKVARARGLHDGRTFRFGDVNLIEGPNGSGKTTLLEAIEFFYCGCNRRGNVEGDFDVEGVIQTSDDRILRLRPPASPSQTRARNLAWYRKELPQSRAILSGFTRFNFLDTDAAYRLSADLDATALDDDLTRLATGSDAATLWEYLVKKLAPELTARVEAAEEALNAEVTRCELLLEELRRHEAAPTESSTLLRTYRSFLKRLGWQSLPTSDDSPLKESERMSIEEASRNLSTLRNSTPTQIGADGLFSWVPRQLTELKFGMEPPIGLTLSRITRMNEIVVRVREVSQLRQDLNAQLAKFQNELQSLEESQDQLASLEAYLSAGMVSLVERLDTARLKVSSARQALGDMASAPVPTFPVDLLSQTLRQATDGALQGLKQAGLDHQRSLAELQKIEAQQSARTTWLQQLQDLSRNLLEGAPENPPCPVCGTEHSLAELLSKIDKLTHRESLHSISSVRAQLEASADLRQDFARTLASLRVLQDVSQNLGISAEIVSVNSLRQYLETAHTSLRQALADQDSIQLRLQVLEQQGLSIERYKELVSALSTKLETEDLTGEQIGAVLRSSYSYDQGMLRGQIQHLTRTLADYERELKELAIESFGGSVAGASIDWLVQQIVAQHDEVRIRLEAAVRLGEILRPSVPLSLAELGFQIDQVTEIFDRSLHAARVSRSADIDRARIKQEYEASKREVEKKEEGNRRLRHAKAVIDRLQADHSLEEATRTTLERIREQINDVFSRIHAPREYEFVGAPDRLLQTRRDRSSRSL